MTSAIMRRPRVLYFIDGPTPSDKDISAVSKMAADVAYRNKNAIDPTGNLETCDGVGGEVPDSYKHLPTFQQAITKREKEQEELRKNSTDPTAPNHPNSDKNKPGDAGEQSKIWGQTVKTDPSKMDTKITHNNPAPTAGSDKTIIK